MQVTSTYLTPPWLLLPGHMCPHTHLHQKISSSGLCLNAHQVRLRQSSRAHTPLHAPKVVPPVCSWKDPRTNQGHTFPLFTYSSYGMGPHSL